MKIVIGKILYHLTVCLFLFLGTQSICFGAEPVTGTVPIYWTRLVQPKPNPVVNGIIIIEVIKKNVDIRLGSVEIYYNENLLKTFDSAPYIFKWDTRTSTIPMGCLVIKAYDQDGKLDEPVCYPIRIRNDHLPAR